VRLVGINSTGQLCPLGKFTGVLSLNRLLLWGVLTPVILETSGSPSGVATNLSFDSGAQNALQILDVKAYVSLSLGAQGDAVHAFLSKLVLENPCSVSQNSGEPKDIGRQLIFRLLQDDNTLLRSQLEDVYVKYELHAKALKEARARLKEKEAEGDALMLSLRLLEEGIAVWQENGQIRSLRASGLEPLAKSHEALPHSRETSLAPFIKCKSSSFPTLVAVADNRVVEAANAVPALPQDNQAKQIYDNIGTWLYLVKDAMRDFKNDKPSHALPLLQATFDKMKQKRLDLYRG